MRCSLRYFRWRVLRQNGCRCRTEPLQCPTPSSNFLQASNPVNLFHFSAKYHRHFARFALHSGDLRCHDTPPKAKHYHSSLFSSSRGSRGAIARATRSSTLSTNSPRKRSPEPEEWHVVFPCSIINDEGVWTNDHLLGLRSSAGEEDQSHLIMQTVGGATALMYACQQCRESEVLDIIRKQPQSVRDRDRTLKTCLHYCAENPNTSCAETILRAAPDLVNAQDENGYSTLHLAVIAGNKALIKLLITKGANVNVCDKEGHSAVHWAIVSSEKEALDMIVRAGANPSTADVHGGYPLHYAVQMCGSGCDYMWSLEDAVRVVETLLGFGVDVNVMDKDSRQPILWAASAGSADAIIHLISAGACVEAADKDGLTALHCAASRGHTTTLETLISLCGASVDVIDGNGCSALFYAVTLGHADATELLLQLGADPNRQDRKGRTPAHCGAAKGQLETLRILQKHGGNLWVKNVKGDIPLHEAVASGRKDLVLWLLSQNPEAINLSNNDGRCPLHIASMYNNTEMVKVLLDSKALVNPVMRTSKGVLMTPLNVALCKGHRSCGKYLQLHGGVPFSKVGRLEPASAFAVRISPSDEVFESAGVSQEMSAVSRGRTSKSRSSGDFPGSQETDKAETSEKKKVYRRRKRKKSASNVPTQDSDSDESNHDVKFKAPSGRKANKNMRKKVDPREEHEDMSKVSKGEERNTKGVSGAESKSNSRHDVAVSEENVERATKANALQSNKSFNETKNVSDLSPEDFPPLMQTINQLDSVMLEPDIDENKIESDAASLRLQDAGPLDSGGVTPTTETEENKHKINRQTLSAVPNIQNEGKGKAEVEVKEEEMKAEEEIKKEEEMKRKDEMKKEEEMKRKDEMKRKEEMKKEETSHEKPERKAEGNKEKREAKSVEKSSGEESYSRRSVKPLKTQTNRKEESSSKSEKAGSAGSVGSEREKRHDESRKAVVGGETKEQSSDTRKSEEVIERTDDKKEEEKGKATAETVDVPDGVLLDAKTEAVITTAPETEPVREKKEMESQSSIVESNPPNDEHRKGEDGTNGEQEGGKTEAVMGGPISREKEEESGESGIAAEGANSSAESKNSGAAMPEKEERQEKAVAPAIEAPASHQPLSDAAEDKSNGEHPSELILPDTSPPQNASRKGFPSDTVLPDSRAGDGTDAERPHNAVKEEAAEAVLEEGETEGRHGVTVEADIIGEDASRDVVEEEEVNEEDGKGEAEAEADEEEEEKEKEKEKEEEKEKEKEKEKEEQEEEQEEKEESSKAKESEQRRGVRVSRLCRRQRDFRGEMNDISVNQVVQNTLRKYHMERGIFYQLLELKRYQIRSGKANEQVLVKRLADEYDRSRVFLGMKPYSGLYKFKDFEKFLYDQLKALNARRSFLIPEIKSYDDIDALSGFLKKSRYKIINEVPQPQMVCTCITQRCHHSACAYTSVPCSAYITDLRRHRRFRPRREGLFPQIQQSPPLRSEPERFQARPATLELIQGAEKHVITLPQNCPGKGKRYYVTFTIKGGPGFKEEDFAEDSKDFLKHRHAKSV